jgi:hypothetical protein
VTSPIDDQACRINIGVVDVDNVLAFGADMQAIGRPEKVPGPVSVFGCS